MSLYFDKNAQTPQNDTVNSWRVKKTLTQVSHHNLKIQSFFTFIYAQHLFQKFNFLP